MRLTEVERGENFGRRLLIGVISRMSGMRLPDAARVAFYHTDFFGGPLGAWTQAAMRGPSEWSVAERELMAAHAAKWNSCAFCTSARGAIAAKSFGTETVGHALTNGDQSGLSSGLRATLAFIEKLTRTPTAVAGQDARAVLNAGVSRQALEDATAVTAIFNVVTRYADALDFAMPTAVEFDNAADMLLKRGYAQVSTRPATAHLWPGVPLALGSALLFWCVRS